MWISLAPTGVLTCLSPITWKDGWPYFGLPGNLKRTPRTWVKPDTGNVCEPRVPYERNDDFSVFARQQIGRIFIFYYCKVDENFVQTAREMLKNYHLSLVTVQVTGILGLCKTVCIG
ncbi:MAG: hypothetical protein ABSE89_12330 [Sedimentisphaerales bacterium]